MRWNILFLSVLALIAACDRVQPVSPDGAELFAQHCSSCHGRLGEGDGPVAAVMTINVPDLRSLRQRSDGSFPRDSVIAYIDGRNLPVAHGDRYMPIWGEVFAETEARIEALTDFLAEIQY